MPAWELYVTLDVGNGHGNTAKRTEYGTPSDGKSRAFSWLRPTLGSDHPGPVVGPDGQYPGGRRRGGAARSGAVEFRPGKDEAALPKQFQLEPHAFAFDEQPVATTSSKLRRSTVTFPSPVVTPHVNNNTVHCEYFCPTDPGKKPGVIVLHILGGDFDLSRMFCRTLAGNGVAALFLKMPYYGERRQPGSPVRMISLDPHETVQGMTQAVLDVRQGAAWLAAQQDIDANRLGIMGISLGGITAALSASLEPRFSRVCLLLAGGDMGEVAWTSTEMAPLRKRWAESGGTKESLFTMLKSVDPVTYAAPRAGLQNSDAQRAARTK